jgi:DNA-binding NtrC family response regulator
MTAPIQRQSTQSGNPFAAVVGDSAGMRHALHMARRVATTPLRAFLLSGETGTGKSLVARCIHNAGLHAVAPFVTIDCASVPAPILEVELFGNLANHREGPRKLGLLELTGRGTVYLAEVGQLPIALQDRLLRTLEEYSVPRFNGGADTTVHCRVIASSKTRLEDRVAAGAFREDLLARLSVLRIELPPLRDREDDVRLIAEQYLADSSRVYGAPRRQLGLDAGAALRAYRWPGNVRELRQVLDAAETSSGTPSGIIGADQLSITPRRGPDQAPRLPASFGEIRIPTDGRRLRDIEREAIELTMQLTDFNQSAAARILCVSRPTLARKLRTYGLGKRVSA